jgi:hypothetical protein
MKMTDLWHIVLVLLSMFSIMTGQTRITILFSNNINGELQNCLCEDQPNGALEKLAFQVNTIRQNNDQVLVIDAGDFYSPFGDIEKNLLLRRAQQIMNFDAINLGDQAFASGVRFFNGAIFPGLKNITTINLKLFNKPLGEPAVFKFENNIKIAVIGIVNEKIFNFYDKNKIRGVKIEDPIQSLQMQIRNLQDDIDFIIVLSHQGLEEDYKLAEQVTDIGLIIGAHSQDDMLKPEKIKQTYIVQTKGSAVFLGRIYLDFSKNKSLEYMESDPILMYRDLPNHPGIVQLAIQESYKNFRIYMSANDLKPGIPDSFTISSASDCASCHQKQYQEWQKTDHAQSFNILQDEKKTNLLKCVACHVSGFGRQDGFINENLTPYYAMITCTECHLTSGQHMSSDSSIGINKINKKTCTRCHNLENDPDFNYEKNIDLIRH